MRHFAASMFQRNRLMVRKMIFATLVGSLLVATAACNTVKGAGKDIQSVGKAGSDAIH
jgi:predicted small secreted protein